MDQSAPNLRNKKVLTVTSVYPRHKDDATPSFVQNICQDLAESGLSVEVIAPHSLSCPDKEALNNITIRRHRYAWPARLQTLCYEGGMLVRLREKPLRKLLLPLFAASQLNAIKRSIRTFQPDIVHAHSLIPQGYLCAMALQKHPEIPLVLSSHGNDVFGLKAQYGKLKAFACNRANKVIANSQATAAALQSLIPANKIETIPASPNEAIVEPTSYLKPDRPTLVFAGRLIPEKGIDLLIRILPKLVELRPTLHLQICGTGPQEAKAKVALQSFVKKGNVVFNGWIHPSEISTHFAQSHVTLVPSQPTTEGWTEAQGLVAVESLAAGTPVIASNIGGLKETITHGKTGYLIAPDDPEEWITSINACLDQLDRNPLNFREACIRRYETQFSRRACLNKTLELYQSMLS